MPIYANSTPMAETGATPYCLNHLMPAAEGDLADAPSVYYSDPVPMLYGQNIAAVVEFLAQGNVLGIVACYVVLQTDWGDGVWIDVAWCGVSAVPGASPTVFTLFAGTNEVAGVFQQTRLAGSTPSPASGANTVMPGPRFRFVGKASLQASSSSSSSSSSSAAGVAPGILVTIRHRVLGMR